MANLISIGLRLRHRLGAYGHLATPYFIVTFHRRRWRFYWKSADLRVD